MATVSTVSLRLNDTEFEQADKAAGELGLSRSEYLRQAIAAMNERVLGERIAKISQRLARQSLEANQRMDDTTPDGLNG